MDKTSDVPPVFTGRSDEKPHAINERMEVTADLEVTLRVTEEKDMDNIKALYNVVYGGNYTLPEVNDRDKMKWAIHDPNYLWLLNEQDGQIVGSVLFVVDPKNLIGKTFAGVVHPCCRGHRMMVKSIARGIQYLMEEHSYCELIYAVVRTFVSRSFHRDLKELGFIDTGMFPNVRKVKRYETHGLKVMYKKGVLEKRRKNPVLTPESDMIYAIIRDMLGLEMARVEQVKVERGNSAEKIEFLVKESPEIEWEYYKARDNGELIFSFYPLHYPQLKLYTKDEKTVVYLHYQQIDGYGSLMGIRTDRDDLLSVLLAIAEYCESMGVGYLEFLIPARDPDIQRMAYEAQFLPCAYFPAAKSEPDGTRLDYLVTCCTFVPPHFKGLKLTEISKSYLMAFFKIYSQRLWEELEDA
ncbi:MAG: hypothetical protein AB9903_10765 [Vulcanimicrobiota bacterium]